jgi:shikimate kinase
MINENENTVVIVGPPAAGKTTLSDQLATDYPDYHIYHTDDYISYGFEQSVYKLLEEIRTDGHKKIIIEGIQSARILRKGIEQNSFYADLVIKIEVEPEELYKRYYLRDKKSYPIATAKGIETVFNNYLSMSSRRPRILTHKND